MLPSFIKRILGRKKQTAAKPGSFPDDDKLSPHLNEKMIKLQPYVDRNRDRSQSKQKERQIVQHYFFRTGIQISL
jgi:hypothetical protein